VAEDNGLSDSHRPVQITHSRELVLLVSAENVILLYVVQRLLLPLQSDDVRIGNDSLSETPHGLLERGGEEQHVTVFRQHSADAHKHPDHLRVHQPEFVEPVQHGAGRADDDLRLDLTHFTFIAPNGVRQFHFRVELPHLLHHFPRLQGELVGGRDTQTLKITNTSINMQF
ncbi:hypothetical protein AMEX_G15970, partial [Astyanax mexicanus]